MKNKNFFPVRNNGEFESKKGEKISFSIIAEAGNTVKIKCVTDVNSSTSTSEVEYYCGSGKIKTFSVAMAETMPLKQWKSLLKATEKGVKEMLQYFSEANSKAFQKREESLILSSSSIGEEKRTYRRKAISWERSGFYRHTKWGNIVYVHPATCVRSF